MEKGLVRRTTAFLDELWQNEKWGRDFEAEDRQNHIRAELDEAACFLALLPGHHQVKR